MCGEEPREASTGLASRPAPFLRVEIPLRKLGCTGRQVPLW